MLTAAMLCLALVVNSEAGGQPLSTQRAVTHVIRNRVKQKHKSVCQVVREKSQFSRRAKHVTVATVRRVQGFWSAPDVTCGATHFHDPSVSPRWAKRMTRTVRYGNLIFYRKAT
jgi:spore germination cell wall hydrolase CwlJ-like protein